MRAVIAGVILLTGLVALIWMGQRRLMYFPFGGVPPPRDAGLPEAEPVTFATADGLTLHGWFVPAPEPPARFTLIIFNGNAGNRAYRAPLAAALRRHDLAVLLFDYRGFGGNPGTPTEGGLASDARAARTYLAGRPDVDSSRLVYFGESLGTAVAVDLATEHPPAALILRSPFASMADLGQFHYPFLPVRWLLRDRYDALEVIPRVTAPLLVIAGGRDTIVPLAESRRLFEAAGEPKRLIVIAGADHNHHALLAGGEMIDAITAFLRQIA